MSVTLQEISKTGSVVGNPISISFISIGRTVKDKKNVVPLPTNHILIPLGKEGPTLALKFVIVGKSTYNVIKGWSGGTMLNVTASTDPEMPATVGRVPSTVGSNGVNCEIWNIDDCKSERTGGQVAQWLVTMTATRYWNWKRKGA